jgi:hypothetical protein
MGGGKKNINELTLNEAKQILNFVYPNNKHYNIKLCFNSEDNRLTMGLRPVIGITYNNGVTNDGMVLHFDNTKVLLWLYKNNYDITNMLEENAYMSEMEDDFENLAFAVHDMSKGEEAFKGEDRDMWTLEYVKNKCKELVDEYFYKDYE